MTERSDVAKKSGAERRRWPRAKSEMSIGIALDGEKLEAKLRDLSRAGVSFYLARAIPLMTVLALSLELPADSTGRARKLRGHGAVVRCERISPSLSHWEIAVFLHDMPEADRAALDSHVRARAAS